MSSNGSDGSGDPRSPPASLPPASLRVEEEDGSMDANGNPSNAPTGVDSPAQHHAGTLRSAAALLLHSMRHGGSHHSLPQSNEGVIACDQGLESSSDSESDPNEIEEKSDSGVLVSLEDGDEYEDGSVHAEVDNFEESSTDDSDSQDDEDNVDESCEMVYGDDEEYFDDDVNELMHEEVHTATSTEAVAGASSCRSTSRSLSHTPRRRSSMELQHPLLSHSNVSSPRTGLHVRPSSSGDLNFDERHLNMQQQQQASAAASLRNLLALNSINSPSKTGSPGRPKLRARVPSYAHFFAKDHSFSKSHTPKAEKPCVPIESHGIIGNCLTTALVNTDASIDWFCYPHHDSPALFHSLLDPTGGCFKITAAREVGSSHGNITTKQLYHTDTNILLTRFFAENGVGHVTDFMPVGDTAIKYDCAGWIVRELEVVRGKMYFRVEVKPSFNFGRNPHTVKILPHGALFTSKPNPANNWPGLTMLISSSKNRSWKLCCHGKGARTKVKLSEGQRVIFVLREWNEKKEEEKWNQMQHQKELVARQRQFLREQLSKMDLLIPTVNVTDHPQPPHHGSPSASQLPPLHPRSIPPSSRRSSHGSISGLHHFNAAGDASVEHESSLQSVDHFDDDFPSALSSGLSSGASSANNTTASSLVSTPTNHSRRVSSTSSTSFDSNTRTTSGSVDSTSTARSSQASETCQSAPSSTSGHVRTNSHGNTFGPQVIRPILVRLTDKLRRSTIEFWRGWASRSIYSGRWREMIRRSALTLKMLTFAPTGAIVQGSTCSLPSIIGNAGSDARLVNLRDGCLAAAAFLRLGFRNEASAFMDWLAKRCEENTSKEPGRMQLTYGIRGETKLTPEQLPHIHGYKHSIPVHTGSAKPDRFCLDMYGAILIAIYLSNEQAEPISWEFWCHIRTMVNFVVKHWKDPDDGMWTAEFYDNVANSTLAARAPVPEKEGEELAKPEHQGTKKSNETVQKTETDVFKKPSDMDPLAKPVVARQASAEKLEEIRLNLQRYIRQVHVGCGHQGCMNPFCVDGGAEPCGGVTAVTKAKHLYKRGERCCVPADMIRKPAVSANGQDLRSPDPIPPDSMLSPPPPSTKSTTEQLATSSPADSSSSNTSSDGVRQTSDETGSDVSEDGETCLRTTRQQYVLSKLMCWVCLDRAVKLAKERSFPAPLDEWKCARDDIYAQIMEKGFDKKLNSFTQVFGAPNMDAVLLLLPVTGFVSPTDPKFIGTLDAIMRSVDANGLMTNSLIHRCNSNKDLAADLRVTTSICTFWAVEACTRAGVAQEKYLKHARLLMEQMMGYSNHLGQYSECIGLRGDFLGNFPHAATHVSLIRSAVYLDAAMMIRKHPPSEALQTVLEQTVFRPLQDEMAEADSTNDNNDK